MKLLEQLRRQFRQEYLGQLIQKRNLSKEQISIKICHMVFIGDDFKKRLNWPHAKVQSLRTPESVSVIQEASNPDPDILEIPRSDSDIFNVFDALTYFQGVPQ
ncbi:hypothetical protein NPIL_119211 [Nephila pilipes]|uniref:DUF5641 domain-containing protein n=1 Tax=Nephila pilipes TaxID=299642 RepID=A0A8X6UQR0_NEPPI|nr:hypothetical protein NPIL_119211 [Nephila pilipes]